MSLLLLLASEKCGLVSSSIALFLCLSFSQGQLHLPGRGNILVWVSVAQSQTGLCILIFSPVPSRVPGTRWQLRVSVGMVGGWVGESALPGGSDLLEDRLVHGRVEMAADGCGEVSLVTTPCSGGHPQAP